MKSKLLFWAIGALTASGGTAQAETYTDPAAFLASLETTFTADFDDLGNRFYGGPGIGSGLGVLSSGGVTIITSSSYLFSQDNNQYGTGGFVSAQQFSPTSVRIEFNASTAFGFNYVSATPITVTVGNDTYNIAASPFPRLSYFGVTSLSGFGSAILSTPGSGLDLDNITFGIASLTASVPEPTTWAMMIGGIGMVGGAMRRRHVSAKVSFA